MNAEPSVMNVGKSRLATWIHSLPVGQLQLTIPLPINSADANDIEELFGLVMRRIRRDLPAPANPVSAAAK